MSSRSFWAWLYWWPVRRSDQMLFAETLSQALAAGVHTSGAVWAAAAVVRSRRFRTALREAAADCRRGYTLAAGLSRTGVAVGGELLATLAVGEERGDLPESLAAFARRCDPRAGSRLAAAVGRRAEVTRFAAALARLLRDRPLTVGLIEDAARLAAGDGSAFAAAVGRVAEEMRGGVPFPEALAGEAGLFDPLFCALVAAPDGRDRLLVVLARLGDAPDAEPSAAPGPADM
jgi:type II secretory pathway component PulF